MVVDWKLIIPTIFDSVPASVIASVVLPSCKSSVDQYSPVIKSNVVALTSVASVVVNFGVVLVVDGWVVGCVVVGFVVVGLAVVVAA